MCIVNCSNEFIVTNGDKWVNMIYIQNEYKNNNIDWIFDTIIPRFGSKLSFDFSIQLSNFLVFKANIDKCNGVEKIKKFMEKSADVEWNVLYSK